MVDVETESYMGDKAKTVEGIRTYDVDRPVPGEPMTINIGPQHPSTHGVLRLVVELEGETILNVAPTIGYLHTGVEKEAETKTYEKTITLTDRMGYLSPLHNNLAYIMAVENLMDVEVPLRAQYIRVILCELDRIASHLVWLGTGALELASMSMFLYCFREREYILDIMETISGARMMTSYIRAGGVAWPLPNNFEEMVRDFIDYLPARLDEYEQVLTRNPLWLDRNKGIGIISAEEAIDWGLTGPNLRASGVDWDLRKSEPYTCYDHFDFDVPLAETGDCYDRYLLRMKEMRQSLRIIRQALDDLPEGRHRTDDRKVAPPPKEDLAVSMEAVIHHFKLWTEGYKPPEGAAYAAVESPRGEMGFYVVSDGSGKPYRVHHRAPSFVNLQAVNTMAQGQQVADLIAIVASLDPVMGEVDR